MLAKISRFIDKLLRAVKLKPLSLAEKCRLQFGAAVLLILTLALLIPYQWMNKLTDKIALDAGRAIAVTVFERHFQIAADHEKDLPALQESGIVRQPKDNSVTWIRFDQDPPPDLTALLPRQKEVLDLLGPDEQRTEQAWIDKNAQIPQNNYIKIVRASDACMLCHNPKGSAAAFNKNQNIGAIVVQTPARELSHTIGMNRLWTCVAGILAATGAMIAFYSIAQRIILRPIRQLRALVNNIAEGNLDARSSIQTDDEYERLSDAFNHMLDGLQESQQKLRQANIQLDAKIAQLSDRNIELFKANKLKSEFLANMSHEFRTPLNAILGFAQLLREKPDADIEKSKRYAANIITSGRSLLNMINDLLDLAKAEAGKISLKVENTSIHQLCESMVMFFTPMIDERNIHVDLEIHQDLPLVRTDHGKVQQILYNLLSNAVKFTPANGSVIVAAKRLDEKTVRISVTDTGPGIPAENIENIFEKFRQVDGSITRQGDGTGLGLAICKELAALLAGSISVESVVDQGSTFHLDIPILLQVEPDQQTQTEPDQAHGI